MDNGKINLFDYKDNNINKRLDDSIILDNFFYDNDNDNDNGNDNDNEEKAIIYNKKDQIKFTYNTIDINKLIESKNNINDSRPGIGCKNNLHDTSIIQEYNNNELNEYSIKHKNTKNNNNVNNNNVNNNKKNKYYISDEYCKQYDENTIDLKHPEGIPKYKKKTLDFISNGSIDFDFNNNVFNTSNEEPLNNLDLKQIEKDISISDQNLINKEGFTLNNINYNLNYVIAIIFIILLMIYNSKCNNNNNKYIFIFIIIFLIWNNYENIESFISNKNINPNEIPEWIKDESKGPLLEEHKNNNNDNDKGLYIVNYKNYKYNFYNDLYKLKEFKIYNKYDYNKGLILFSKYIKEINIFNKIYCTNFINYLNNSYKSIFIDNAYTYLKDSIKHLSYINLNINDKYIENAIMTNNFDIYELNNKLYDILSEIYGIGFNILYIISKENDYKLDFDDKFINIFTNHIYMNNPDSFMEIYN